MTTLAELLIALKAEVPKLPPGLPDGVVPSYLIPGYFRASTADEISADHLRDRQAVGALLHSALFDCERLVRDRAIRGLLQSRCDGLENMLIACTFDDDEEIRLLALEAILDQRFPSATETAHRLAADSDEDVAQLARTFLSQGEWFLYKL